MSDRVPYAPGMRVICRDAEWLVTRVEPSDYDHEEHAVHCLGTDDLVRGHESVFLTQLDRIEPIDPRRTRLVADESGGYRLSRLYLEAQLRQLPATGLDPNLDGMGAFEPMPFQERAVEVALRQLRPRLLLADDVGLGKTIEVGMILTELMRRGRASRILVLAKKSMLTQFQSELWNRFAIPLVRLDSAGIAKLKLRIPANRNPFEVYHRVIISLDTLKDVGNYRHFLEGARWDVVVIDEAHNVAGASVPERNLSHRLARLLSRRTDSLLLTTATPHNGKKQTFGRLISLLDVAAIPDPDLKEYEADDIRGLFLMRFKEDIRAEAGEQLADRIVVPREETTAPAAHEEEEVFSLFTELRTAALDARQIGVAAGHWARQSIVLWGLYKQFLSSPESCRDSLERYVAKREEASGIRSVAPILKRLESSLAPLRLRGSSRYGLLRKQLDGLGWDGSPRSPRVLIFTEYRRTLDALAEALAEDYGVERSAAFADQPRQVIATVHGTTPDVHLTGTIEAFATGSAPMRLLIASDVAAEGVNLHHECHRVIHYDLPWSIITLIQRNGRIDRLGQRFPPELRYLMVTTEEGFLSGDQAIFERLIEKVEEINRSTRQGQSQLKVYDPDEEERLIAERGILEGDEGVLDRIDTGESREADELERMLREAGEDPGDLAALVLGEADSAEGGAAGSPPPPGRLRLLSDREYLLEGYRHLARESEGYAAIEEKGPLLILNAPDALRERLGSPDARGDVIFGATAIPAEAWPENDQFHLTDDPARVEEAIRAARHLSGYWSRELLVTEQHPILRWITERLLMLFGRGTAPLIASPRIPAGELAFVFAGQLTSNAGVPLVVDAHAIVYGLGGGPRDAREAPLGDLVRDGVLRGLSNTTEPSDLDAAQGLVEGAVELSLERLRRLRREREVRLTPLLRHEERRLRDWLRRREELIEARSEALGEKHRRVRKLEKALDDAERYVEDRKRNWRELNFYAQHDPTTQLLLVIHGVNP